MDEKQLKAAAAELREILESALKLLSPPEPKK
jgi:hypothetical protein